jgi:hypothetical protein
MITDPEYIKLWEDFMKRIFFVLLFSIIGYTYAQESIHSSNNGTISIDDGNYLFIIVLVNDLDQTISVWDVPDKTPSLKQTTQVKINDQIAPFIVFGTQDIENINLTYSCKIRNPDGTFSEKEANDLILGQGKITPKILFRGRQFLSMKLDEDEALGKYQFYIAIKENDIIIHICIMEFELVE